MATPVYTEWTQSKFDSIVPRKVNFRWSSTSLSHALMFSQGASQRGKKKGQRSMIADIALSSNFLLVGNTCHNRMHLRIYAIAPILRHARLISYHCTRWQPLSRSLKEKRLRSITSTPPLGNLSSKHGTQAEMGMMIPVQNPLIPASL